ncbi:hypothetical protein AUK04_01565 [Candidatus Roizmanbacteria bacterium CG2_30_33_16]|uniref:purine-nucleoside phosphorylase n=1 Tax=Candidatus Roizmanbacteria bacterium CG2_30_33_16 TaxID=1805340 RepID=A0A1J5HJ18_9BACT|nr:MAG: hypothetical protein AUK04_01565 [Candidatus Roizmanbacteria bacterium CG2_30_33_16]
MFDDAKAFSQLQKKIIDFPETVVVLGSGWNKLLDNVSAEIIIDYDELFGVKTTVPGHKGQLIIASVNKKRVAFMSGRFHMYEGYNAYQSTTPIRVFTKAGMKNLILTAACGGLNKKYQVGDFIILNDIITLFLSLDNPLQGTQFVDLSQPFSNTLRKTALKIAKTNRLLHHEGNYVYYHGPNYESFSDKKALANIGADVCGMSVVPEVLVARSLNINVLGLTFVTNLAFVKHNHKEVVAQANKASQQMKTLLLGIL